jgi:hypothetical protein
VARRLGRWRRRRDPPDPTCAVARRPHANPAVSATEGIRGYAIRVVVRLVLNYGFACRRTRTAAGKTLSFLTCCRVPAQFLPASSSLASLPPPIALRPALSGFTRSSTTAIGSLFARTATARAALQPAGRPLDFSLNAGRGPPNGTTMLSKRFTGIHQLCSP